MFEDDLNFPVSSEEPGGVARVVGLENGRHFEVATGTEVCCISPAAIGNTALVPR